MCAADENKVSEFSLFLSFTCTHDITNSQCVCYIACVYVCVFTSGVSFYVNSFPNFILLRILAPS